MTVPHDEGRTIIARGRIRVDARRALAKLREHLLVDLHLYTVEIARAAVAAGATFLDIDHDADEVILTFDGEPISKDDLPRLLDHVLGDDAASARALRGLALGVNAALGLRPAFVDIYTRTDGAHDKRRSARVRFLPSVLQAEDADLPPVEDVAAPAGMPARGTRVHVRRRMSLDVLKRAAARNVPPEVALLVEALHEAPLELRRAGALLPRPPRAQALLRVPFRERDMRRGTVEILASPAASPSVDYLELGVLLLRRPFVADPLFPTAPHAQVELPVRVVVDADELPTNASRSSLREDAVLPQRAEQAARVALVDALRTLVALVTGEGEPIAGVEVLHQDAARLEDALGAFACVAAGAHLRGAQIADHARALLDLPLLRDATNRPMRPAALFEGKEPKIHVWNGKEPLDAELGPWMDQVVWLRGRVVERMLVDFTLSDAAPLLAAAQAGLERRRRLHARPPIAPTVPPSPEHLLRETFQVQEGPFKGLRGELALGAEGLGTGERPSSIRVFVEGRHLDTVEIDRQTLPLAIDAAIAWDGRLLPRFTYEGVRLDENLHLAIFQLTRLALLALGSHIEFLAEQKRAADRIRLAPLVRAAVGAYVLAAERLDIGEPPPEPHLSAYTPIWTRGFWPSTESQRVPISLAELKVYADRTGALCHAPPDTLGTAPDRRPVIAANELELSWLKAVFPGVTFVPYARALLVPGAEAPSRMALMEDLLAKRRGHAPFAEPLPAMPFDVRGGRGLIAPGKVDEILWLHAGVLLALSPTGAHIEAATLVMEYDGVVPNPAWNGVHWTRDAGFLTSVRNELLRRILAAFEGDAEAKKGLHDFPEGAPGIVLRTYLMTAAARYRKQDLATRIEALALFQILGEDGEPRSASLAEIARIHPPPSPIPVLRAPPGFSTLEWRPVIVADDGELAAFSRWSESRAARADDQLDERRGRARTEQERRAFLEKPRLDPRVPGDLADPESPVAVTFEEPTAEDPTCTTALTVAAALPRRDSSVNRANIEFLFEGRLLCVSMLPELPLPVVVRADILRESLIVPFHDITAEGLAITMGGVWIAACALAVALVQRASGRGGAPLFFEDLRVLSLVESVFRVPGPEAAKADTLEVDFALRAPALLWPTVQGEAVPCNELTPGGSKLHFGRVRYPEWRRPPRSHSALDKSIVHLPTSLEGDLVRAILVHMGHELVDVSEALEQLQQKRTPGAGRKVPALGGEPAHPALRASLEALGAGIEGEVEIIAGPTSAVHLEDLRGNPHPVTVEAPFPIRARARVDSLDIASEETRTAVVRIAKAATTHLESLADRLDELPPFVRHALRRVLCVISRKAKNLAERRTRWRVLPDIYGGFHSLEELDRNGSSWPYTTLEPPYPSSRRERPPLFLTPDEVVALASRARLEDASVALRREMRAEQRRNATALSRIGLDAKERAQCLGVFPFRGDGVEGEIGILAPEHAQARGIAVHVSRRPLCRLSCNSGWPVLAAINDDTLEPNAAFDGIKGQRAREQLRTRVESQARDEMRGWFDPPEDVLAGKSVHGHTAGAPLLVTGILWLPSSWRAAGLVEVRDPSTPLVRQQRLVMPGLRHLDATIPVAGRLLVGNTAHGSLPDNAHAALAGFVLREATAMLEAAIERHGDSRVLQCYRWNLRLIGAHAGDPSAPTGDGRIIGAGDIVAELEARGALWTTRREGSDIGVFPSEAPSFVLLDDGGPLMDVLQARAQASLRELGGAPAAVDAPAITVEEVDIDAAPEGYSARGRHPAPEGTVWSDPSLFHAPDEPEPVAQPAPQPEPAASWFAGLVRRVALLFGPPEPPPDPATQELGQLLLASIGRLGLSSVPVVTGIRYVRKGRPFRYDIDKSELVVNRAHPGVRSLADRAAKDARARVLLVAAAVREINRTLELVTDATERRVLLSLLRGGEG
jgi:hypothetical protein